MLNIANNDIDSSFLYNIILTDYYFNIYFNMHKDITKEQFIKFYSDNDGCTRRNLI